MKAARISAPAALVVALGTALLGPAAPSLAAAAHAAPLTLDAAPAAGQFSLLTYNVAGLPELLSSGNPAANTRPIGERVNAYDIVNVQEDFNYHADLYDTDLHPYATPTSGGVPFGDGLNTMSAFSYSDSTRVRWGACNGTDCLTPKGFTLNRIRLAEGVQIDLYNAHPNAGTTTADLAARRSNISQLTAYIVANSAGNAVIVAGDTNTRYTRGGDNIRELVASAGLTDVWVQQERGGVAPAVDTPGLVCDPANVVDSCEVVDKILYRSSRAVALKLDRYHNENARFLDAAGAMLSDHYPHAAWFSWTLSPVLRLSDTWGGPHGTSFNDVDAAAPGTRTTAVTLRAGSRLDQVGVQLADGRSLVHGGGGGSAASLTLGAGEYVTQVRMDSVVKDGHTRIGYLKLTTNQGRALAGGSPTAQTVTFTAPAGFGLGGFFGRSGDEIDRLGAIWTPAVG